MGFYADLAELIKTDLRAMQRRPDGEAELRAFAARARDAARALDAQRVQEERVEDELWRGSRAGLAEQRERVHQLREALTALERKRRDAAARLLRP